MTRTDPHRPSVIDPTEYEFVAFQYQPDAGPFGLPGVAKAEREAFVAHQAATGGRWSGHEHGGTCGVCGAHAVYTVIFWHRPTNVYISTGNICADKMQWGYDEGRFDLFKTSLKADRELRAGLRKGRALAEDNDALDAWQIFEDIRRKQREGWGDEDSAAVPHEHWTIVDIFNKLVRYGSLSEKQWKFVKVLPERARTKDARKAQWAAEKAAAKDAPKGRVEATGKVLKVKWSEYGFRDVAKMVVKTDEGWLFYATVPESLFDAAAVKDEYGQTIKQRYVQGSRITIRATFTPSDDDPKFAFGKRPVLINAEFPEEEGEEKTTPTEQCPDCDHPLSDDGKCDLCSQPDDPAERR